MSKSLIAYALCMLNMVSARDAFAQEDDLDAFEDEYDFGKYPQSSTNAYTPIIQCQILMT